MDQSDKGCDIGQQTITNNKEPPDKINDKF